MSNLNLKLTINDTLSIKIEAELHDTASSVDIRYSSRSNDEIKNEEINLQEFDKWLQSNNYSDNNCRRSISQIEKLVRGEGVTYKGWADGVIFRKNDPITMQSNIVQIIKEAREFEKIHGRDKGNGWLLNHPLRKLQLYLESTQSNIGDIESESAQSDIDELQSESTQSDIDDVELQLKMKSAVIKQLNYYSKEFEYQRINNKHGKYYRLSKIEYPFFAFKQVKNKKNYR